MALNYDEIEGKVVGYMDTHTRVMRIVAWAVCVALLIWAVMGFMRVDPIGAAVNAVAAVVILWLLVKTRPAEPTTP